MKKADKQSALSAVAAVITLPVLLSGCSFQNEEEPPVTSLVTTVTEPVSVETEASTETTQETLDPQAQRELMCGELLGMIYLNLTGDDLPDSYQAEVNMLVNNERTIDDIVLQIISSEPMLPENMSDEDFISACYRTFCGCLPDESQMRFFTDLIADGTDRSSVARMLMQDQSFEEVCSEYDVMLEYMPPVSSYFEDRYAFINNLPTTSHVAVYGDFVPSAETLAMLYEAMDDLNYGYSFIMLDINTGRGISYNLDEIYYTASSIKEPWAASFCCLDQETAQGWENTMISMLENSDNDAYAVLNDTYHRTYIQQWCEQIGVDPAPFAWKYPHVNVRQMAALWMRMYQYFEEDEYGAIVGSWMENPNLSVIHSEVGDLYTTRSKAGWYVDAEDPYRTCTVDAGIVYADNGPYIVVIMTHVPSSMDYLIPLMQAMEAAHQDM